LKHSRFEKLFSLRLFSKKGDTMQKKEFHPQCYFASALIVFLNVCLFISCKNPTDELKADSAPKTQVQFKNLEQFPVSIYSDASRQNVFAEIEANSTKTIAASPNPAGTAFYPAFRIDVPDIEGVSIPYNGPTVITLIEENKTTLVPIPKLETVSINQTYIKLINSSNFSLSLNEGDFEKPPLAGRPSIITPGQSAGYQINHGPSSSYTVMRNTTTPVDFPASFTEFEKGKVYTFTYNGTSLVLTAAWPIPSPAWPAAPENVQAEVISTSSVRLSWDAVNGAASYRVYRAIGSATSSYYNAGTTNIPSFTNTNLPSNTWYYYKISAIKDSKEGEQSKVVPIRIIPPPGNVSVAVRGDDFVLLVWNNVSGASTYNIYRAESQSGNYLKITGSVSTILGSGSSYFWDYSSGLKPLTTYYYRVSGANAGFEGLQSSAISVATVSPIDFRVTGTTARSVSFAWNPISGAKYNIYRSASENGTFTTRIINLSIDTRSYTDGAELSPNSTYWYYIGITYNINYIDTITLPLSSRKVSATTEGE
jgi:fibronectin type 3 domain-containing protein